MVRYLVFASIVAAAGCATSQLTAYRDPAFAASAFERVAIFAVGMELGAAAQVERQVCDRVGATRCVQGKLILPPTRRYEADSVARMLADAGVDAVLIVALVTDDAATSYLGTIGAVSSTASGTSAGSGTLYGNVAVWTQTTQASVTSQVVATPVYGHSRVAFAQVGLYDRATGRIAWGGELKVSGQGQFNVTDDVFIASATAKIAEALRAEGLLR